MEVVASSSSSSPFPTEVKTDYDVFISFRGEDTREGFTSHLYEALLNKKVHAYLDEVTLRRGEQISPTLLQAIRQSKISLIVFSENYAESPWCLDELLRIMECKDIHGQEVVPIFYRIDPSCVRKQKGAYEAAFVKLQRRFKDEMEKVQAWRTALTNASNLSGWSTHQIRPESQLIKTIVEYIVKKLRGLSSSSGYLKGLAGIHRRMKQVESMLRLDSPTDGVVVVGIWGIGGIGKTTLARAVFQKISHQFEGCCFLSNVREEWDYGQNKYDLRSKLFSELLEEETKSMKGISSFDENRLLYKKVLIVLDDANDPQQLDFLTRDGEWFGLGSRIIITTRDLQLLKNRADYKIYRVEELSFDEAFEHFQMNALRRNIRIDEFTQLSKRAVVYAEGIPLVLQVLMGSLFSYKSKEKWESVLDDLKDSLNEKIHNVLKISYDGLTRKEKDIFLDIACFFKGYRRSYVERILKGCDSFVGLRIDNLVDKSLITIEEDSNSVRMHDLVQEMCWNIVIQQSIKEPGKRSRLWNHEDVYHVLKNNKVSAEVEGIFVDYSKITRSINLSPHVFFMANDLRLLKIYSSAIDKNNKLCFPSGLESLPDALRLLHWEEYPLKSLPMNFDPTMLVELSLRNSQVEQLWDGIQNFPNLKFMDLFDSQKLTSIPELSQAPNLERIDLRFAFNLTTIPDLSQAPNLKTIHLDSCMSLTSLPNLSQVCNIKKICLSHCFNLTCIPDLSGAPNLEEIELDYCKNLLPITSQFQNLEKLIRLDMNYCVKQTGALNLRPSIEYLYLKGCQNLKNIPELKGNLTSLYLSETSIEELPSSIGSLDKLFELKLDNCKGLKSIHESICQSQSLNWLTLRGCSSLENLPNFPTTLRRLDVSGTAINQLPTSIESLHCLTSIYLTDCKRLQTLPACIYKLKKLVRLDLNGCSEFENFPDILEPMENLRYLSLARTAIKELPSSFQNLPNLEKLDLGICTNLKDLPLQEYPDILNVQGCTSLETVSLSRIKPQPKWDQIISFFGCLNLDQNARNTIISHGQRKITYIARQNYRRLVCICYPGEEIPEWFNYVANCSETVQVQLPLNWHSSDFLGFAVCFVAEFDEYKHSHHGLKLLLEFQVTTKAGECHKSSHILETEHYDNHKTKSKTTEIVNSDHVFMLYEYKSFLVCQEIEEADDNVIGVSFSICPIRGYDVETPVHSCRVKTCGFRLLYVKEAQEFGLLTSDDSFTDLFELCDSMAEDDRIEFFGRLFSSNDCQINVRDCCEYTKEEDDDESNTSYLGDSASKKEDYDAPSTSIAAIDCVEPSTCHATHNSVSADAEEHDEQEPIGSEIEANSAAKDHEEDVNPRQSGTMDSIEADNEDVNSFSNGCVLFLSHMKAICMGIFGITSGNERLLEVTIQNLRSENRVARLEP